MTAIVGIEAEGKVWLGGDSAISDEYTVDLLEEPKVWVSGPYALGWCGCLSIAQIVKHAVKLPKPPRAAEEIDGFVFTEILGLVQKTLKERGVTSNDNSFGATLLLGVMGRVYTLDSFVHVRRSRYGYAAAGSGEELCLGSLATSNGSPRARVLKALRAAERHSNTGVRAPFTVVSV